MFTDFSSGNVGLALTQTFSATTISAYLLTQSAELTMNITAVERLAEYMQLPPECEKENKILSKHKQKNLSIDYVIPPANWPTEGRILFKNVYLRYSENERPVLKKLNFVIQPKEKV